MINCQRGGETCASSDKPLPEYGVERGSKLQHTFIHSNMIAHDKIQSTMDYTKRVCVG